MLTYEFVIVAALLTSPPMEECPITGQAPPLQTIPTLWEPTLRAFARDADVITECETRCSPFIGERALYTCQYRYWTTYKLPRAVELDRFPPRHVIITCRALNYNFRAWCERDNEALALIDYRGRIYDALYYAYMYETPGNREYLQELRELLGDAAFYRGELPPAIPLELLP